MIIRTPDGGRHYPNPENTYSVVYVDKEVLMQALILVAGESKWSAMNHTEHWCHGGNCDKPGEGPVFVFRQDAIPDFTEAGCRVWLAQKPMDDELEAWRQYPMSERDLHIPDDDDKLWNELDQMGYWEEDND